MTPTRCEFIKVGICASCYAAFFCSQLQYVITEDTITARGLLQEGEHELRYEVKSAQGDVVIITLLDQNEDTTILVHSRDYIQFEVPPISFRRQGTSGAE